MCLCSLLGAQTLAPVTWEVYGLTFHAPKGAIVEEDTEETVIYDLAGRRVKEATNGIYIINGSKKFIK